MIPKTVDLRRELGIPIDEFEIRRRCTVVAGLNGSGKSRLVRAIASQLAGSSREIPLHMLCEWLVNTLRPMADLETLAAEKGELSVDEKTLASLQNIVRRNYDYVYWYAVDLESPFSGIVGEAVAPYFRVSYGGVEYDSLGMGLGELSVHVLLWSLWYLRDRPDTLLVLDEPDAYLPPQSRKVLLEDLLALALDRKQAILLCSHAHELMAPAAAHDSLTVLVRSPDRLHTFVGEEAAQAAMINLIERPPGLRLLLFVEDDAAAALARSCLKFWDIRSVNFVAVVPTRGTGSLVQLARQPLQRQSAALACAIVPDGDPPGREVARDEQGWPVVYLPGPTDPDGHFFENVKAGHLAARLSVTEARVRGVLSSIEGAVGHRWTEELIEGLGVDRLLALEALADVAVAAKQSLATDFVAGLQAEHLLG